MSRSWPPDRGAESSPQPVHKGRYPGWEVKPCCFKPWEFEVSSFTVTLPVWQGEHLSPRKEKTRVWTQMCRCPMVQILFISLSASHSPWAQVSLLSATDWLEVWTLLTQSFVVSGQKMKSPVFFTERQQISIQKCNFLGWFCFLKPILSNRRKQLEHIHYYGPWSALPSGRASRWWVLQVVTMVTNQGTGLLGECSGGTNVSILSEEEDRKNSIIMPSFPHSFTFKKF